VSTLIVAAGGGGDAITAAALHRVLRLTDDPIVMTYSWDRLMIDPIPGPRSADDFTNLRVLDTDVSEVVPATLPIPPARSSLPGLARDLTARLVLLDPTNGAQGMARQIDGAARHFGLTNLVVVDVGGDALTLGPTDPGLRSPLADQLAIAACLATSLPGRLVIAGAGLDGEITADVLTARLTRMNAQRLPDLTAEDFSRVAPVFTWHPSEASGLLAAAALGHRGIVEVRDAGDQVALADNTPALYAVDFTDLSDQLPAKKLLDTRSLKQAAQIVAAVTGISELDYESAKAKRLNGRRAHTPTTADLHTIDAEATHAAKRGATYVSMRRLAELVGTSSIETYAALGRLLAVNRPGQYLQSIYQVTSVEPPPQRTHLRPDASIM
jgi:hypothetical protein